MKRYINSGVEIVDQLPDDVPITIAEDALQHIEMIASNIRRDPRKSGAPFDVRIAYKDAAEVVAPPVFSPLGYCRLLGFTAMSAGYGREFAVVDLGTAASSKLCTELAQDEIAHFARSSGGFIFIGHTLLENASNSAKKRATSIYSAVRAVDLPAARVVAAPEGEPVRMTALSLVEPPRVITLEDVAARAMALAA